MARYAGPIEGLISQLVKLPGIGEKTARRLLDRFGSLDGIRSATEEHLSQVVNRRLAALVRAHWPQ